MPPRRLSRPPLHSQTSTSIPQPRLHPSSPPQPQPPTALPRTIASLISSHPIPWPPSLLSLLKPLLPELTRPLLLRSLDLILPPSSALLFFRHAQLHLPSSLFDDRAHFKMLQVLCRSRHLSSAHRFLLSLHSNPPHDSLVVLHDRFFNALIRAYASRGRLRDAVSLFHQMRHEFRVPPSVFSLNSLLSALLRRGRTNSARKLFEEMTRGDDGLVPPDVCTFNTMIRGLCMNGVVGEAFHCFKEMASWQCKPDRRTYNTLLDGLCRVGKVRIASNLLGGMRSKGRDVAPDVVSYTTVIRGFCGKGCLEEAVGVFKQMVSEGVEPNSVTFNTLIQGLCEADDLEQIKEIFRIGGLDFGGKGFKPDTCTFNTLINFHCKMGRVEDAMKVFAEMPDKKLKADSATYSMLIRALCQAGEFRRAEELLDELVEKDVLLKRGGCMPIMASYNPIFEYLCQNGKARKAATVFSQILKKGTVDISSFRTIIVGHCKEGDPHGGYELLAAMLKRDLIPDEEICQALLSGFMVKGDMIFAWKTFEKTLNSGHQPKTATFHLVLKGLMDNNLVHESGDLIVAMLERKVRQNINLSTEVAIIHYKNGLCDKGFEIVRLLYDNGYSVKMENLISLLFSRQKYLEALRLLLFSVEKDHILGSDVYVAGISGLCQIGRGSEAFRLFYELNEKGKGDIVSCCLMDLEVALEKEGKSREARFIYKRRINSEVMNTGM